MMKKAFLIVLVALTACQTVRTKNNKAKVLILPFEFSGAISKPDVKKYDLVCRETQKVFTRVLKKRGLTPIYPRADKDFGVISYHIGGWAFLLRKKTRNRLNRIAIDLDVKYVLFCRCFFKYEKGGKIYAHMGAELFKVQRKGPKVMGWYILTSMDYHTEDQFASLSKALFYYMGK